MRLIYLSVFVVVFDQVTKLLVKGLMKYGESIELIGDFLKLTYVENPGMAFGLDFGPTSKMFLSLFSVIASIGLVYYLYKIKDQIFVYRLSIALILGGAFGNLIDRVFYGVIFGDAPLMYGKVVDFLNVEFFDFTIFGHTYTRWPIFNIADASVTIGVLLLIFFNHKIQASESEEKDSEAVLAADNDIAIADTDVDDERNDKDESKVNSENDEDNNREEVQV